MYGNRRQHAIKQVKEAKQGTNWIISAKDQSHFLTGLSLTNYLPSSSHWHTYFGTMSISFESQIRDFRRSCKRNKNFKALWLKRTHQKSTISNVVSEQIQLKSVILFPSLVQKVVWLNFKKVTSGRVSFSRFTQSGRVVCTQLVNGILYGTNFVYETCRM